MIFGFIKKIISIFFKGIYTIISVLNLQFLLFVGVVGGILYLMGVVKENQTVKILLIVFAGLAVIYAVVVTFMKLFGLNKPRKRRDNKPKRNKIEAEEDTESFSPLEVKEEKVKEIQPKYFRVKQNPNMVMAEYEDRYELFDVTDGDMKKIRTDYK